jgi:hypothetical protein
MIVGIVHGAVAFTRELFGTTVGVVSAAQYIVSLHVANNKRKRNYMFVFIFITWAASLRVVWAGSHMILAGVVS